MQVYVYNLMYIYIYIYTYIYINRNSKDNSAHTQHLWHTYARIMAHIEMSHDARMHASHRTYETYEGVVAFVCVCRCVRSCVGVGACAWVRISVCVPSRYPKP